MGRPLKWQTNATMQAIVARNRAAKEADRGHWLDLQKAERYTWHKAPEDAVTGSQRTYYRHMGVVESLFDCDGELWCGRADLHQNQYLEVKTTLSDADLRERIVLAWTLMRHSHVLLSCRAGYLHEIQKCQKSLQWTDRCFVYSWPGSVAEAIEETTRQVQFVGDHYSELDVRHFFHHVMNTSRAIDSQAALSKLYVMPFKKTERGTTLVHLIPILAHQITDGLTTFRWSTHLSQILNLNQTDLHSTLASLLKDEMGMLSRLPPAQEALYPLRSHNPARERWHWLLTRILRHVRVPPPAAFQNPLRREQPLERAEAFPPDYGKVLEYDQTPPLNAGSVSADLYGQSAANMRRLCKQAGISIGSGCFTLVAMVMMEIEQRRDPDTVASQRLPFVGSFPVNPRPFFSESTSGKENSCMLAFSDGVTMPFLPRDLDFVGRFRLLGRLAHKQLRQYQKRKRSLEQEIQLGSRSPSQLIPSLYCSTLERMEGRMEGERKAGVEVQGQYAAKASPTLATCGISSVGDVSAVLTPPKVDLNRDLVGNQDLVADFKGMASVVRPRDGEFLVGSSGNKDHFGFLAAYDANAIDAAKVGEWKMLMESMLDCELFDDDMQARL